jgi:hypothetical protein
LYQHALAACLWSATTKQAMATMRDVLAAAGL